MKYKRILLKLSGEALLGKQAFGIDPDKVLEYVTQIKEVVEQQNVQVAIVIGGGNIFRGMALSKMGVERATGDYMGMLGTVMNGLALQGCFEQLGVSARLMSAIEMPKVCELYTRYNAIRHLEEGRVVILSAGTGYPFFTTDTAAALRAVEINANVLLKGTRVDGVYSADPEKDAHAIKFDTITFEEVLTNQLRVMDLTAFTLCQENELSIIVFDVNEVGNLKKIVAGEIVGTVVQL